jgi:hypothetical protein
LRTITFCAVPEHYFISNLVSYDKWLSEIGITAATGYRWRKRGMIRTVNVYGRVYIARTEIADFERNAAAGAFAKEIIIPKRPRQKEVQ